MKTNYSQINNSDLREAWKFYKKFGEDEFLEKYISFRKSIEERSEYDSDSRAMLYQIDAALFFTVHRKRVVHYFLDKDVFYLIKNIGLRYDPSGFIKTIPEGIDAGKEKFFLGVIHSTEIKSSISFFIRICQDEFNFYHSNGEYSASGSHETIFSDFANYNFDDGLEDEAMGIERLIVNLFYYMSAFPESIENGVPKNITCKYDTDNAKKINTHESMKKYIGGAGMIPHLRSGHFRYLGSEFYKNKRGQTVFVHPVFVNSKNVKTVNATDNIEAISQDEQ